MGKLKDLRAKLADGSISDEEKTELDELESDVAEGDATDVTGSEDLDAEVDKLAGGLVTKLTEGLKPVLDAMEAAAAKSAPVKTDPEGEAKFVVDKAMGRVSLDKLAETKVKLPGREKAGKEIVEVSGKTIHFLSALYQNDRQKLQLLSEGAAGAGGYLVPDEFANMIVEDLRDESIMRQLAQQITISGDTFHLPTLEGRPKAQWRAEGAAKATSTAQFNELVFTPYSIAAIVGLTTEVEADASLGVNGSLVNYIANLMTVAIAEKQEAAFWNGSGSGQPTGISQYSIASISAGASLADAIQRLYHRLPQGYRKRAVWVANQQVWESVALLKDANNNYLLKSLADSPTEVLKGRPVYEQNDLPANTLYFGDPSYYMIVDREGIAVKVSDEATVAGSSAFEKNLVFVRVEARVDGELTLTNAWRKITGI